jgi:Porin subfamily
MRNALLVIAFVTLLPAAAVAAEQARIYNTQKSDKTSAGRQFQMKGAGTDHSCAVYGPGFARVDGTQTCVKIGGAVSIGVGGSR